MHKESKCKEFCLQMRFGGAMASSDVIRHKVHFQNCCHNRARKVNIKFVVEVWNHDVGTFHVRFAIYELQDHRVNKYLLQDSIFEE